MTTDVTSTSTLMQTMLPLTLGLALVFMTLASFWRIFNKAGEPGWKCLVPIYGAVVFHRIIGRPTWWIVLLCIPFVNIIPSIMECFDLARVFGKGAGFGLGILLLGPLFFMVLAFGSAEYVGPLKKNTLSSDNVYPMRKAA